MKSYIERKSKIFGDRLKGLLKHYGYTQKEFAAACFADEGFNPSSGEPAAYQRVRSWCRGVNSPRNIDDLIKIVKFFNDNHNVNVSIDYLLGLIDETNVNDAMICNSIGIDQNSIDHIRSLCTISGEMKALDIIYKNYQIKKNPSREFAEMQTYINSSIINSVLSSKSFDNIVFNIESVIKSSRKIQDFFDNSTEPIVDIEAATNDEGIYISDLINEDKVNRFELNQELINLINELYPKKNY